MFQCCNTLGHLLYTSAPTGKICSKLKEKRLLKDSILILWCHLFTQNYRYLRKKVDLYCPYVKTSVRDLMFFQDPVGHNILWLQLLETFCHFSQNLCMMVEYEAAATIMGTMAAHRACPEIQSYSCQVLAWLANYRCLPYDKVHVKLVNTMNF